MAEKMDYVYLVKIYDSTGRLLPVVTAFATRQGAEAYVHDFLPTGKYQEGAAACKAEIVKTEVRESPGISVKKKHGIMYKRFFRQKYSPYMIFQKCRESFFVS